ncbi:MAG: glycosyltransferase [Elusimicrobiota bacterium]|nr:glycosyltransferase [Elusimicrobiota bacterium]
MKVNIVSYEDPGLWIFGKFAKKLHEEVSRAGVQCALSREPDPAADINHHISYINYRGEARGADTLMITHVDTLHKLQMLKGQLAKAAMGICMSRETQQKLVSSGLPADRLCYINPAHDGVIKPRPLVLGITSKVHADGRKGEETIAALCKKISPLDFRFIIMGAGWKETAEKMRALGFGVDYYGDFDYGKYTELVPSFDYYLYISHDEGSMGFLDALSAGVQTMVTPQGYHLDAPGGLTLPVNDAEELAVACLAIAAKRRALPQSVASWTWPNYARKHIDLWHRLLEGPSAPRLPGEPYPDGTASLYTAENAPAFTAAEALAYKASLLKNSARTFYSYFPEGKISVPLLYGKAVKLAKRLLGLQDGGGVTP